jgi:putative ABC transport system permease protein
VFPFIWAQLRLRAGRTAAMAAAVLIACTGFTVLTGSVQTSRLTATGVVDEHVRAAYDILVRPAGSRSELEQQRGLVRPNFLSGLFGGISQTQWEQVRAVPGVEVAAPIAMLGYAPTPVTVPVDLTDLVDRSAPRQLFRLRPRWAAERGLTVLDDAPHYVYVTRRPVHARVVDSDAGRDRFTDGTVLPQDENCLGAPIEIMEDGRPERLCGPVPTFHPGADGLDRRLRGQFFVFHALPDGTFVAPGVAGPGQPAAQARPRLVAEVTWRLSLLVAAVDPDQEAGLVGIDAAVQAGRYLTAEDRPRQTEATPPFLPDIAVPSLLPTKHYLDESLNLGVERLDTAAAALVPGAASQPLHAALDTAPGSGVRRVASSAGEALLRSATGGHADLTHLIQAGSPSYDQGAGPALTPQRVPVQREVWEHPRFESTSAYTPLFVLDDGYRPLVQAPTRRLGQHGMVFAEPVGQFDPEALPRFSPLSRVPLETYQAPQAPAADERSAALLGTQLLLPTSNPAGYLTSPPLVITTLAALPAVLDEASPAARQPISAIRVRVAGVTGPDEVTLERIRLVAERIATATGLDVDITFGSSPQPQAVALPAGRFGRPDLLLYEGWSRKGVAVQIAQAVDRKSVLLFALILVVCALALANAVLAAVRDRRRELAVLACLGWSGTRLVGALLGEVGTVGLAAGVAGAALAVPVARLAGIEVDAGHALLAVPVGLALAMVAAVPAVLGAVRASPAAAVHPPVARMALGGRRRRGVVGLAVANLARTPGRTAAGAVALAVGIFALTMVLAVTSVADGVVVGTLLGDAVSVRIRSVDAVAVAATVVLGALAVGDVLYLNIRDRAGELAVLQATGWSAAALGRLVGYEGLGIGLLGAVLGVGAGVVGAAWLSGEASATLLGVAAAAAGIGVLVAAVATVVPALLLRRLPVADLLAEE